MDSVKEKWATDAGLSLAPPCPHESALSHLRNAAQGLLQTVELDQQQEPLPQGWERVLNLQSGEMFFYNPGMNLRTRQDPRKGIVSGAVPSEWNWSGLDHNNAAAACNFRKNSYSQQLQKMKSSAFLDSFSRRLEQQQKQHQHQQQQQHPVLDLTLNLSSSSSTTVEQQQQQQQGSLVCKHCLMRIFLSSIRCPNCGIHI